MIIILNAMLAIVFLVVEYAIITTSMIMPTTTIIMELIIPIIKHAILDILRIIVFLIKIAYLALLIIVGNALKIKNIVLNASNGIIWIIKTYVKVNNLFL